MIKNKNSKELELLRLEIFPYRSLVNKKQIAQEVGVKPDLVYRVLKGSRTDRYGIIKRMETHVIAELNKVNAIVAEFRDQES
jgi:hypothetical protein